MLLGTFCNSSSLLRDFGGQFHVDIVRLFMQSIVGLQQNCCRGEMYRYCETPLFGKYERNGDNRTSVEKRCRSQDLTLLWHATGHLALTDMHQLANGQCHESARPKLSAAVGVTTIISFTLQLNVGA